MAATAAPNTPSQPEAPTLAGPVVFRPPTAQTGQRWMVVTANRYASEAAANMLRNGGHAVDAAIAAQFVLNLVEPQSSGIGGGGFMLVWDQAQQRMKAYDGRETAPAQARLQDYLEDTGEPLPFPEIVRSGKAVGVPGLPALLGLAHRQHGQLPWGSLLQPAIDLATQGFFVSPRLQSLLEKDKLLRDDPHAAELFYPNDQALTAGVLLTNPALAQTFRQLAQSGADSFYRGDTPRQIIRNITRKTNNPSTLTEADFSQYRAIERAPLCTEIKALQVCGMPPPSAGGVAVLQILRLLELQNAPNGAAMLTPQGVGLTWDAPRLTRWLKASRLAYEDRIRHVGDPDRVEVDPQRLISRSYLRRRLSEFSLASVDSPAERPSTTHLSIVDEAGNAVSMTTSIEDQFGSRIMVNGFLLNNQLTDFDFRAPAGSTPTGATATGATDATSTGAAPSPNRFEPGKRPRSSMAPTLVLSSTQPAHVVGIIGSPGGSQIPSFIASRLMAHWWGQYPIEQSVAAGHVTLRENRLEVESGYANSAWIDKVKGALPALPGRDELPVNVAPQTSGVHWIVRDGNVWRGVADPRREGVVIGE